MCAEPTHGLQDSRRAQGGHLGMQVRGHQMPHRQGSDRVAANSPWWHSPATSTDPPQVRGVQVVAPRAAGKHPTARLVRHLRLRLFHWHASTTSAHKRAMTFLALQHTDDEAGSAFAFH